MKIYLRTRYGDQYHVLENGNIVRLDISDFQPSGQWKFLGIRHVLRNEFIPFSGLAAALPGLELLFKNGNPRYTVVDLDHGTRRIWGNTRAHGLVDIRGIK